MLLTGEATAPVNSHENKYKMLTHSSRVVFSSFCSVAWEVFVFPNDNGEMIKTCCLRQRQSCEPANSMLESKRRSCLWIRRVDKQWTRFMKVSINYFPQAAMEYIQLSTLNGGFEKFREATIFHDKTLCRVRDGYATVCAWSILFYSWLPHGKLNQDDDSLSSWKDISLSTWCRLSAVWLFVSSTSIAHHDDSLTTGKQAKIVPSCVSSRRRRPRTLPSTDSLHSYILVVALRKS